MNRQQVNIRLVFVEWVDTVSSAGWDTKDEIDIKLVKEVGWLIEENAERIKIARTISEEEYYSITAIPKGCIKSVKIINHQ
mgnify:FL=1